MRRAVLLALGLAGCVSHAPKTEPGSDPEYLKGEADAVKRLYWARQALERQGARPQGRILYYVWEESGVTRDGRRLAPEEVGVPVFVPTPPAVGSGSP